MLIAIRKSSLFQRHLEVGVFQVSKKVMEFLRTPEPAELWHYTPLDKLEKILSSGKIWATEARHTSDSTEYVYAKDVALKRLRSRPPTDEYSRRVIEFLQEHIESSFQNGLLSSNFADVFVASFSAAEDLKSQWAEYGDAYKGVSIAFDLSHVRAAEDIDTSLTLAPCIYDICKQETLILDAIGPFLAKVDILRDDLNHNLAVDKAWPVVQSIYGDAASEPPFRIRNNSETHELLKDGQNEMNWSLFVLVSLCKNPEFRQEDEWRIVLPRSRMKNSARYPIQYRDQERGNNIVRVPYIAMDLDENTTILPITRVMAGPKCDCATVQAMLERHGYRVPVDRSRIPIR